MFISTWAYAKPMFFYIPNNQALFYFQLDANPSTGYQWKIKDYDHQILRFIKSEYIRSASQRIGSGGKMRFYFKSLNSKTNTIIHLEYGRPWEKDIAFSRVVHIKSK